MVFFISCQQLIEAPVPDLKWEAFDSPKAKELAAGERVVLEGIYSIGEAADDFGKEAALKWSYVVQGKDTAYYLSFFCREDVRYFICRAKRLDSVVLLNGYWRNVENTKTGKAHFTVQFVGQRISIDGTYGMGDLISFINGRTANGIYVVTWSIVMCRGPRKRS